LVVGDLDDGRLDLADDVAEAGVRTRAVRGRVRGGDAWRRGIGDRRALARGGDGRFRGAATGGGKGEREEKRREEPKPGCGEHERLRRGMRGGYAARDGGRLAGGGDGLSAVWIL